MHEKLENIKNSYTQVASTENKIIMNSNQNFLERKNTKRFISNALNRLMAELTAMEESEELVSEYEEVKDNYTQQYITNSSKKYIPEIKVKNEHIELVRNDENEIFSEALNEFPMNVMIKEEPDDHISIDEDQIFNSIINKTEIKPAKRFLTEVTIKKELEDFISMNDDAAQIPKRDLFQPHIQFMTEVTIKTEEEESAYDSLECLEDIKNNLKYLKVMLTKIKCYMCEHCPVFYKRKKDLIRHIHIKHYLMFRNLDNITKSLHYCVLCDKKLSYKRWNEHMTVVHTDQQYKCSRCDKVLKNKNSLRRHIKYIHDNQRPQWKLTDKVNCPLCSKEFNNKHTLLVHTKTFHSDKPYTCKICNSTLKCKVYLNAHMRRVHYDDGKKHGCDICGKEFRSPRYLRIHKKNSGHKYTKEIKRDIC